MSAPIQDMGVDLGRRNIFVTQQLLDGADVIPTFQEVGRKRVAKRVRTDWLVDSRQSCATLQRAGEDRIVNVVPPLRIISRVYAASERWEYKLPRKVAIRIAVFTGQRVRKPYRAESGRQVHGVERTGTLNFGLQWDN